MTNEEYRHKLLPALQELWPGYVVPAARMGPLWDRLCRFPLEQIMRELRRLVGDDLDAKSPKWAAIFDRLAESRMPTEQRPWTAFDETSLSLLQEGFYSRGLPVPSDWDLITQRMGRSMPTSEDRRRVRQDMIDNPPDWASSRGIAPTLENLRRIQQEQLQSYLAIIARAPGIAKRREPPLCEQGGVKQASWQRFLEAST